MQRQSIVIFFMLVNLITKSYESFANQSTPENIGLPQDGKLSFKRIAEKYGYHFERRTVITEDGYILTLYHIKGDFSRPVLLVHGNTGSAECWIVRGRLSLAITLASQGYDVWAINLRGTTPSRIHMNMDADEEPERFFNYSFYEQGIYDIPATIDHILKETNQTQLLAIGHSCGTTAFYVMGAEKPAYNEKIKAFISLAPICFLKHLRGLTKAGIQAGEIVTELFHQLRISEIFGLRQTSFLRNMCLLPLQRYEMCVKGLLFKVFGPDEAGLEDAFLPAFLKYYPAGSSAKMMEHLVQVYRNDRFAKFDYGKEGNLELYDSVEPPEFDLSKVTMKVALLVGREDYLASVKDTERLSRALPNVIRHEVLSYEHFNHVDFIYGKNMKENLYPFLLNLVNEYA